MPQPDYDHIPKTRPRRSQAPLTADEELLAEIFTMLMVLEDTNRVDDATRYIVESLPWDVLKSMRAQLERALERRQTP